jgi:transcriptional regulator with XRE-family HTH domain
MKNPIATNLKKRRKEKKLTQKAMANFLQIKSSRYSSWEEGRAEPSTSHLVKIAEVLQVDDLYLFLVKV